MVLLKLGMSFNIWLVDAQVLRLQLWWYVKRAAVFYKRLSESSF